MNHLFRVVLVLSLATVAVAALIVSNNHANPRPAHQLAVEEYVAYRRSTGIPTLTIKQYVEARMPQNFRPDMSKLSFGYSIYYMTDRRYGPAPSVDSVWPLTGTATPTPTIAPTLVPTSTVSLEPIITATLVPTMPGGWYGGGGKPMPYPPNDLWCAQLSSPDPAAPKVVLAGLHQDMYNAEWIVHEVTDPATVLPAIGCQFAGQ
jgi:hypothetical protein